MISDYKENCIIGYTGFIGQNISKKINFKYFINSKNIDTIINKEIDLLICAAPSAEKWSINLNGENDINNINNILNVLKTIKVNKIILLSSIDIYGNNVNNKFNELNIPDLKNNHNYGLNRIYFENNLKNIFNEKLSIFRLSGLFGNFLKKNFLFDIKNNREDMFNFINYESSYQWYNIDNLYNDINTYFNKNLVNIVNEPIKNYEIIEIINKKINIKNNKTSNIINYDVCTIFSDKLYLNDKKETLIQIRDYLNT